MCGQELHNQNSQTADGAGGGDVDLGDSLKLSLWCRWYTDIWSAGSQSINDVLLKIWKWEPLSFSFFPL